MGVCDDLFILCVFVCVCVGIELIWDVCVCTYAVGVLVCASIGWTFCTITDGL